MLTPALLLAITWAGHYTALSNLDLAVQDSIILLLLSLLQSSTPALQPSNPPETKHMPPSEAALIVLFSPLGFSSLLGTGRTHPCVSHAGRGTIMALC